MYAVRLSNPICDNADIRDDVTQKQSAVFFN
jgi:hypothetical protein